ncbi:MAG TPA: tol-pal system protein YbgF [Gammaproteobacteria bacterium]
MTALFRTTTLAGLAATAACSTMTPADDPLALKVTDLEARLIRVERVLQNDSLIQLSTSIDQLRSEVQQLRGDVETLRFETENGAERQRDLYVDLDSRLQALEQAQSRTAFAPAPSQGGFPASSGPAAGAPAPQAGGTDQQAYQAAFELIQARRYQDAASAFQSFLTSYPQSPLTDNAQYWLAETYYVQRDFAAALPEFQKVIDNYPRSAKLPDALLKVGYCNAELDNVEAAREALERVMREYPETTAARLAAQRLERLPQG